MIEFKEVDRNNFFDVINLKVADNQMTFVASNVFSIAQSKAFPECIPLAVYHKQTLIGFVMYCIDLTDQEYWIYRIMIDQKFQGKGYGKKLLESIIQLIKKDKTKHKIYLSVEIENTNAIALYKQFGFSFDGRIIDHEHVMLLEY